MRKGAALSVHGPQSGRDVTQAERFSLRRNGPGLGGAGGLLPEPPGAGGGVNQGFGGAVR
jgi:hypothetical protein